MLTGRVGQRPANCRVSRGLSTPNVSHVPRSVGHTALNPEPLATPQPWQKYQTYLHLVFIKLWASFISRFLFAHKMSFTISEDGFWIAQFSKNCCVQWNSTSFLRLWSYFKSANVLRGCSRVSQDINVTWETCACWQSVLHYRISMSWFKLFKICLVRAFSGKPNFKAYIWGDITHLPLELSLKTNTAIYKKTGRIIPGIEMGMVS